MFSFCIVIMPLLCMVFAPLKEVGIFHQNSSPCNLSSFFFPVSIQNQEDIQFILYKTGNTATLLSNSISTIKLIVSFLNGVNYTVQHVPSCAP